MKITLAALVLSIGTLGAQDVITFTNRTAVFTNLEGRLFKDVQLVRADLDGLIWRSDASGGRICYTNLNPDLLESFGISSNRIAVALARAQRKAVSDAQYRASWNTEAKARLKQQADEQAKWLTGAPARDKEAQRQADLSKIAALRAQIAAAQNEVDIANAVTPVGAAGDPDYVNAVMAQRQRVNLAQIKVNNAQKQLEQMESEYRQKYGKEPGQ